MLRLVQRASNELAPSSLIANRLATTNPKINKLLRCLCSTEFQPKLLSLCLSLISHALGEFEHLTPDLIKVWNSLAYTEPERRTKIRNTKTSIWARATDEEPVGRTIVGDSGEISFMEMLRERHNENGRALKSLEYHPMVAAVAQAFGRGIFGAVPFRVWTYAMTSSVARFRKARKAQG